MKSVLFPALQKGIIRDAGCGRLMRCQQLVITGMSANLKRFVLFCTMIRTLRSSSSYMVINSDNCLSKVANHY